MGYPEPCSTSDHFQVRRTTREGAKRIEVDTESWSWWTTRSSKDPHSIEISDGCVLERPFVPQRSRLEARRLPSGETDKPYTGMPHITPGIYRSGWETVRIRPDFTSPGSACKGRQPGSLPVFRRLLDFINAGYWHIIFACMVGYVPEFRLLYCIIILLYYTELRKYSIIYKSQKSANNCFVPYSTIA